MIEFVYGSDQQFAVLKESLEDHLCHVYPYCSFPGSFSRANGRLGFEKEGDTYVLYIDKGIRCSNRSVSDLCNTWLSEGELRFLDFTDMKEFLRNLNILYS